MRRVVLTLLACLALPAAAHAAGARSSFVIRGAGYGHGIGLSQYGADGYAQHGYSAAAIVKHYYTGSALAIVSPEPTIRVLLQSTPSPSFSGATSAGGRTLDPARTYSVRRAGPGSVKLIGPSGKSLGAYTGTLRVAGPAPLTLDGLAGNGVRGGHYRGALEFRAGLFGGVSAINALGLEDYVRGVVSAESPSSWPAAALQAQAIVARSYAITTDAGSAADGFTAYADTRSQMYRGVAAEYPSTQSAVQANRGQVVTYGGVPVVTYFFSTSGGRTENVENSFVGALPRPWLKGVADPFDSISPRHRWGPYSMSLAQAAAKLGRLVNGRFESLDVRRRGFSPRVVQAQVVSSGGRTTVTGPQLRRIFGLYDSWAYYTSITCKAVKPQAVAPGGAPAPAAVGGGTAPGAPAVAARAIRARLLGTITPARRGSWVRIQRRAGGRWKTYVWTIAGRHGSYRATIGGPGTYRVLYRGAPGPSIGVR